MRRALIILVVLLLLVVGLAPGITGYFFKQNYLALIASNQNKRFNIQVMDYRQGWFSSSVVLKIMPQQDAMVLTPFDTPSMTVQQTITHGPVLYDQGFSFGIASIKGSLHLPQKVESFLLGRPNTNGIGTVQAVAKFNGDLIYRIEIPKLNATMLGMGSLVWDGLQANVHFYTKAQQILEVDSDVRMGQLVIQSERNGPMPFVELTLLPINQISVATSYPLGIWIWRKAEINFAGGSLKKDNVLLGRFSEMSLISNNNIHSDRFNLLNNFKVTQVEIPAAKLPMIAPIVLFTKLDNLNLNGLLKLNDLTHTLPNMTADTKQQVLWDAFLHLLTADTNARFELLIGTSLGNLNIKSSAAWPATAPLPKTSEEMLAHVKAEAIIRIAIPLENFLVNTGTSLLAEKLRIETPSTPVAASVTPDITQLFANRVASLLQQGKLSVEEAVQVQNLYGQQLPPETFAINLKALGLSSDIQIELTNFYTQLMAQKQAAVPGPSTVETQREELVVSAKRQLDELIQQGYILKESNDYVATLTYEDGQLKVNGKPWPPAVAPTQVTPPNPAPTPVPLMPLTTP